MRAVLNHVLGDRIVIVVNKEDMTIQSCLWWYGYVMHREFNSQMCEVMEVEITGKRKKSRPRKLWEECVKKDFELYGLRDRMRTVERNGESKLEQKFLTLVG